MAAAAWFKVFSPRTKGTQPMPLDEEGPAVVADAPAAAPALPGTALKPFITRLHRYAVGEVVQADDLTPETIEALKEVGYIAS